MIIIPSFYIALSFPHSKLKENQLTVSLPAKNANMKENQLTVSLPAKNPNMRKKYPVNSVEVVLVK